MPANRKPPGRAQGHRPQPRLELVKTERIETPSPPSGLGKEALEVWAAFWGSEVAGAVDAGSNLPRLVRWITYVDEWHKAMRGFRRKRVVKGSMGQPVLNPLSSYIAQLETAIVKAEVEFGLSPLARLKLGITLGEAALTADKLNQMIEERGADHDPEAIEGEWADDFETG